MSKSKKRAQRKKQKELNAWRMKTLEQLEGQNWGEPDYDSYLVRNSHRLYRLPLHLFEEEDLRFMIGQRFGLKYLIPLALRH